MDEHCASSAFPDQPGQSIDWLARQTGDMIGASFVTRGRYGAYLQHLLREATEQAEAGRLILENDAAVGLRRDRCGWALDMARAAS